MDMHWLEVIMAVCSAKWNHRISVTMMLARLPRSCADIGLYPRFDIQVELTHITQAESTRIRLFTCVRLTA